MVAMPNYFARISAGTEGVGRVTSVAGSACEDRSSQGRYSELRVSQTKSCGGDVEGVSGVAAECARRGLFDRQIDDVRHSAVG